MGSRYPRLFVAISRARYGNYKHWALYLETDDKDLLFEVEGEYPAFHRNHVNDDPRALQGHEELIQLDTISVNEVATVQQQAETVVVDNDTIHWNCQDCVLEILEKLEDECVVDVHDRGYCKAKNRVMRRYGPTI